MAADPLVTLDRFFDPIEARIVAGRLKASGIPVHLFDVHHASANWMLIVALGGVRLQVPLSRLDEAKRLLEENVALEAETDICPRCGGLDSVMDDSPSWKASLLAAHLVGVPLPWKGKRHRCRDCGHEWNDGGP